VTKAVNASLRKLDRTEQVNLISAKQLCERVHRAIKPNKIDVSSNNFNIPKNLITFKEEEIVKIDFKAGENRIIGFSTNKLVKFMAENDLISCDGTFKVVPKPFYQLYIFYTHLNDAFYLPTFFFLLQDKKRTTYVQILRQLKDFFLNKLNIIWCPKYIMLDFENAMISAIKLELSCATIKGCYFHFTNAINKKIINLNLKGKYLKSIHIYTLISYFTSLAFLPADKIIEGFEILKRFSVEKFPETIPFCKYFENQWMVKISPLIWTVFGSPISTNNSAEGFNNALFFRFGRIPHQNLSVFFSFFQDLFFDIELKLFKFCFKLERPRRPRKRLSEKKIKIKEETEKFSSGLVSLKTFLKEVTEIRLKFKKRVPIDIFSEEVVQISQPIEHFSFLELLHQNEVEEINDNGDFVLNEPTLCHSAEDLLNFLQSKGNLKKNLKNLINKQAIGKFESLIPPSPFHVGKFVCLKGVCRFPTVNSNIQFLFD